MASLRSVSWTLKSVLRSNLRIRAMIFSQRLYYVLWDECTGEVGAGRPISKVIWLSSEI